MATFNKNFNCILKTYIDELQHLSLDHSKIIVGLEKLNVSVTNEASFLMTALLDFTH